MRLSGGPRLHAETDSQEITRRVSSSISELISSATCQTSVALRFTLIIPAYNEEEALASTLERALAARREVLKRTPVTDMTIVLVDDGSTDETITISEKYEEVIKIHFKKNLGYGAAIKAGFQATDAEVLGFMDADGTCDPLFCVDLINKLLAEKADVAVGSRMNRGTAMPNLRRFGNFIFARLIGTMSGRELTDCASGMRVLRRKSLRHIHPLPDGLHFTPAMTCLALLDSRIRMVEMPMPYSERIGSSKLHVIKDGFAFLFTILFTAALFNPIKALGFFGLLLMILGLASCAIGAKLGVSLPLLFVFGGAFLIVTMQALFAGFLCQQVLQLLLGPWRVTDQQKPQAGRSMCTKRLILSGMAIFILGIASFAGQMVLPNSWQKAFSVEGAFLVILGGWLALTGVALRVIWAANERRNAERDDPFAFKGQ